jgi:hypothetical protein
MIDQEVASRVQEFKGKPQALQEKYAASQQLIDLLALQKIKSMQESAAREMQLQMAQQQAANGESNSTIAQQREKEVMDMTKQELAQQRGELAKQQQSEQQQAMQKLMGGIASAPGAASAMEPQAMAAGGIVAFDNGGPTGKKPLDEKAQAALEEAQRSGDRNAMMMTIKKLGAAGYDVATLIPRAFMGVAEDLSNTRLGRALGADFKIPQEAYGGDRASMTPMMDQVRRQEQAGLASLPAANAPAPAMDAETQKLARLSTNPPAAQNMNPALQPTAPMAPPPPPQAAKPPMPNAPPAPAAPPKPQDQGLGGLQMGPSEDTLQNALRRQSIAGMNIDPKAEKLAEEKRIEDRLKLTPEQRAVFDEGIAGQKKFYDRDFDPETQRREGIKRYLLGMGGRSMGEFAGGAETAMNYDTAQNNQQRARFNEMQKSREGLIGLDRGAVTGGIEGGYKAAEQAGQSQRTALTAGANVFGTETQSKDNAAQRTAKAIQDTAQNEIERLKIGAQNAATAAQRDANDFAKLTGHLSTITNNRARAEQAVVKAFQKDAQAIEMALMANPKDKEALNRRAMLQVEIDAAVDKTTKPFDALASSIQAKLYGGGQGGLGGFTVREKPAK